MAKAPEYEYNAKSRQIAWKLDIYFDGASSDPVSITKENFLISANVLEEACASSRNPWGDVSANELTASIRNLNDIFNPSNADGPYYQKIRTGVKVAVYIRPFTPDHDDTASHEELSQYMHETLSQHTHEEIHHMGSADPEYDWDEFGVFYVADWVTKSGGLTADITCYDKIGDILGAPKVKLKVMRATTQDAFIQAFFDSLFVPVVIDSALSRDLPYGYHVGENKDFLNNVSAGMNMWFFCDHLGAIHARYMRNRLQVAHTITDNDQIINISAQHALVMDYDGIQVYWKVPQVTEADTVLQVRNTTIPADGMAVTSQVFTKKPVVDLTMSRIIQSNKAFLKSHLSSAIDMDYEVVNNDGIDFTGSIEVYGRVIETSDTVYTTDGVNLLKLNNDFVQTREQFDSVKAFLNAYVSGIVPLIEIDVRGNPQFEIGQKIHVDSTRFNTLFDGVLIRQELKYDGGMTGTITLMNSRILEVT